MRYPWGHFQFGSNHLTRCNVCDSSISIWTQPSGELALPKATRNRIREHVTACGATA